MQVLVLWSRKHSQSDILQISFFTLNLFLAKREKSWGCLQMKTTEVDGNKLNGYEKQEEQKQPQCHRMESIRMWDAQGELGYLSIMQIATVHIWFRKCEFLSSFARFACHKSFLLFSVCILSLLLSPLTTTIWYHIVEQNCILKGSLIVRIGFMIL